MREELGFDGTEDHDYEAIFSLRPRYGMYVPHAPVDLICEDPSLTDQSQAADADINTIMARYEKTGTLPDYGQSPMYGDFSDMPTFMEAQEVLRRGSEAFAALPSRVRAEFDNDPAQFVAFASDPGNVDQMRIWGLAKPLDEPEVTPAPPAPPAEPAAS